MADIMFKFGAVPNRYVDVVQRASVLYPVYGVCNNDEDVRSQAMWLVTKWRKRLSRLRSVGWYPCGEEDDEGNAKRFTFMRNCIPSFAIVEPRTKPCKMDHFCPFCYARWVRDIYKRIDEAFPPPEGTTKSRKSPTHAGRKLRNMSFDVTPTETHTSQATFDYHLVERRVTFTQSYAPGPDAAPEVCLTEDGEPHDDVSWLQLVIKQLLEMRSRLFKRMQPLGGFSHYLIEPAPENWLISNRQLFMIKADDQFELSSPSNANCTITRHDRPTRKVIYESVLRTCKYPELLLDCPEEHVDRLITLFEARKGRRLTTTTGTFRRSKQLV
jgi:hypothetical protein